MQSPFFLAEKMGKVLGRSEILQRSMSHGSQKTKKDTQIKT